MFHSVDTPIFSHHLLCSFIQNYQSLCSFLSYALLLLFISLKRNSVILLQCLVIIPIFSAIMAYLHPIYLCQALLLPMPLQGSAVIFLHNQMALQISTWVLVNFYSVSRRLF